MLAPLLFVTAQVAVDLSESGRHLVHTRMTIPVAAGKLTLLYPKWIPGEHGPTGPIKDIAGLTMTAAGKPLDWTRDPKEMYAFNVDVPAGTATIDVAFDLLSSAVTEGFSSGASTTPKLALLSWNQVVLYPATAKGDAFDYEAKLTLPKGWTFGTALPLAGRTGNEVSFQPVSLTRLVDSPVLAGENLKEVPLGENVVLDVAADNPEALAIPPEVEAGFKGLVAEADALFGSRHFEKYHFLLTVSDQVAHFGLEHHESSDDRVRERVFLDPDVRQTMLGLLPHEYVHSWNGKYRRPADLLPDELGKPIDSSLLWVYEGLTQYLGWVLTSRSGLRTPQEGLDDLALTTAEINARAGRSWRPLEDTATAAQLLYETPDLWGSWRRSVDFYDEGTLLWLEADVTIRQLTKGAKSLDDFCKRFHGGPGGKIEVKAYRFEDVVAALNATAPYDWATFLKERVRRRDKGAPMGGIEKGGWKLDYSTMRHPLQVSLEDVREVSDFRYAIGIQVKKDGTICDVVPDSAAWKAGVAPGMTVVAVNDLKYSGSRLRDAVRANKSIRLILENGESYLTAEIPDTGVERYPYLVRGIGDDLLGPILAPRSGKAYKKN